jgi:hypothetical protein
MKKENIKRILNYVSVNGTYNIESLPDIKKLYTHLINYYMTLSSKNSCASRLDRIVHLQKINGEFMVISSDTRERNKYRKSFLMMNNNKLLGLLKDYEYTLKKNLKYLDELYERIGRGKEEELIESLCKEMTDSEISSIYNNIELLDANINNDGKLSDASGPIFKEINISVDMTKDIYKKKENLKNSDSISENGTSEVFNNFIRISDNNKSENEEIIQGEEKNEKRSKNIRIESKSQEEDLKEQIILNNETCSTKNKKNNLKLVNKSDSKDTTQKIPEDKKNNTQKISEDKKNNTQKIPEDKKNNTQKISEDKKNTTLQHTSLLSSTNDNNKLSLTEKLNFIKNSSVGKYNITKEKNKNIPEDKKLNNAKINKVISNVKYNKERLNLNIKVKKEKNSCSTDNQNKRIKKEERLFTRSDDICDFAKILNESRFKK